MSERLVPNYELLQDAKNFKGEFLAKTFVGHFDVSAGTLGCLVKKTAVDDDEIFILSNNHVLADSNQAQIGDDIIEPGKLDGGTDPIAKLTDFETIFLDNKPNFIDAAIAKVINNTDVQSSILTIGDIQQPPMTSAGDRSITLRWCGRHGGYRWAFKGYLLPHNFTVSLLSSSSSSALLYRSVSDIVVQSAIALSRSLLPLHPE